MPNANLLIKGSISIDSTGKVLQYHTIVGDSARTAGIDSITTSNYVVIYTKAFKSNSLVFVTLLSDTNASNAYVNLSASSYGNYFVVESTNATSDNFKFNWFILNTY